MTGEGKALSRWHLTLEELRARAPLFERTAVAVGNFDGVHVGHAHILQWAIGHAVRARETPIALTFDPHPRAVVGAGAPPALATAAQRDRLMLDLGIEAVVSLRFDQDVAALSPEQFVRDVLVEGLGARRVVVGDNFRFGRGAQGTTALLQDMGDRLGFAVHVAPVVRGGGDQVVSSSLIRRLLTEGDVAGAAALLRRTYSVIGHVVGSVDHEAGREGPWYYVEVESGLLLPGPGEYDASMGVDGDGGGAHATVAVVTASSDDSEDERRLLVSAPESAKDLPGRDVRIEFDARRP